MDLVTIAVADDHKLFRRGLVNLIHSLHPNFKVCLEADNGQELLHALAQETNLPNLILSDANMPILDGYETAEVLQKKLPEIPVLVITMNNDEESLIRMLKQGVKGYIGKDIEPHELLKAITEILEKGFYYTNQLTSKLILALQEPSKSIHQENALSEQELLFIQLACSEKTYAQIADAMFLSPKTIDGYRASVFEKLNLKSRVGMVIYAIKTGLVKV